ncbi:MAG: YifB family Mg chelatase-like AAA ATPase [Antricoccus sp.]
MDAQYASVSTIALDGVNGIPVAVECHAGAGTPGVQIVGLPDSAISEARNRIRAAISVSKLTWTDARITFNLAPAHVRKTGTGYDLAMAMALQAAYKAVPAARLSGTAFVGELGLDGTLHKVRGVLPAMLAASRAGFSRIVLPDANRAEAAIAVGDGRDMQVMCAPTLHDVVAYFRAEDNCVSTVPAAAPAPCPPTADLTDVRGQPLARRALEIAAAGGHHLLMVGPPGAGKTMLAARMPSILPPLDEVSALEVTSIHSLSGTLDESAPLHQQPPFEAPHHSATAVAIIGGGSGLVRPGSISRAHRGILFLDEAPEFSRHVLDQLRQPIESGSITVHRAAATVTFPARFQLIMAANPCPCAAPLGDAYCVCTSSLRRRYLQRLSGPLMDRIDMSLQLQPASRFALLDHVTQPEGSSAVLERVTTARARAIERWSEFGGVLNSAVPANALARRWQPDGLSRTLLDRALEAGALSARGLDRVLRVSWTLADLAGRSAPAVDDVAEALSYRDRSVVAVA